MASTLLPIQVPHVVNKSGAQSKRNQRFAAVSDAIDRNGGEAPKRENLETRFACPVCIWFLILHGSPRFCATHVHKLPLAQPKGLWLG